MVKLTYGGNLSVDSADDSGNMTPACELGRRHVCVARAVVGTCMRGPAAGFQQGPDRLQPPADPCPCPDSGTHTAGEFVTNFIKKVVPKLLT